MKSQYKTINSEYHTVGGNKPQQTKMEKVSDRQNYYSALASQTPGKRTVDSPRQNRRMEALITEPHGKGVETQAHSPVRSNSPMRTIDHSTRTFMNRRESAPDFQSRDYLLKGVGQSIIRASVDSKVPLKAQLDQVNDPFYKN